VSTVRADVQRSLYHIADEDRRDAQRAALEAILHASVSWTLSDDEDNNNNNNNKHNNTYNSNNDDRWNGAGDNDYHEEEDPDPDPDPDQDRQVGAATMSSHHRDGDIITITSSSPLRSHALNDPATILSATATATATATVEVETQDVYYYQGLHDVATVLVHELGGPTATMTLRRLVRGSLRDWTREKMAPAMALVDLFLPLLSWVDAPLARAVAGVDGPPAMRGLLVLPWIITWFST
jgi:hypothetical protein